MIRPEQIIALAESLCEARKEAVEFRRERSDEATARRVNAEYSIVRDRVALWLDEVLGDAFDWEAFTAASIGLER